MSYFLGMHSYNYLIQVNPFKQVRPLTADSFSYVFSTFPRFQRI